MYAWFVNIFSTGAVLFNLHSGALENQIRELLGNLNDEKLPLWKQMRCLEVIAAVLAETLMQHGTIFSLDPEEIT